MGPGEGVVGVGLGGSDVGTKAWRLRHGGVGRTDTCGGKHPGSRKNQWKVQGRGEPGSRAWGWGAGGQAGVSSSVGHHVL